MSECVGAIRYTVEHADDDLNTYNPQTRTTTSVTAIADIVSDELGVDPEYTYTGGDRGWTGDVPRCACRSRSSPASAGSRCCPATRPSAVGPAISPGNSPPISSRLTSDAGPDNLIHVK